MFPVLTGGAGRAPNPSPTTTVPPARAQGEGGRADGPQPLTVTNAPPPLARVASAQAGVPAVRSFPVDPSVAYAVSSQDGALLLELLQRSGRALDPDYAQPLDSDEQAAVQNFYSKRTRLLSDALAADAPAALPAPVSEASTLKGCRTGWNVLERLLKQCPGLVIGKSSWDSSAEQLLSDNMKALFRMGVRTLYLEQMQHDLHQADIDGMHRTGYTPAGLRQHLEALDSTASGLGIHGSAISALVDKADREGLQVVALDMTVSHHLRGAAHPDDGRWLAPADIRARAFSHVAAGRIHHHQATRLAAPGPQRWVALVSENSAGTYNGNPGLAARTGVPSLRVESVACGRGSSLRAGFDPGLSLASRSRGAGNELQCDHLLKVTRIGLSAPTEPTPEPCSAEDAAHARLMRAAIAQCARSLAIAGNYRIAYMEGGARVLVHRSSSGALVAQPIDATRDGGVRLRLRKDADPGRWAHLRGTFPTLDALRAALSTRMEEVTAPVSGSTAR
jgi:hypothetical protein